MIRLSALITVLAVLTAMAPLSAFISERFPSQTCTTGFGIAQQLGNILFGGFLPLINGSLVNLTGNPLARVVYSIASLVPCLLVTLLHLVLGSDALRLAQARQAVDHDIRAWEELSRTTDFANGAQIAN
ncbi:hypothetical protein GCM10010121_099000 [Streptomyces brasiliensis]|uniref:Major facilitator superfamily (MFS) profile domain-containing protein n=1 Tax=Streptomyces brasiliensis TaxID=1954 RepID=A0A917UPN4_9ACTN|nr:hypothetical protein GCM10010121_099000 [Streptomyces brasiliensis]